MEPFSLPERHSSRTLGVELQLESKIIMIPLVYGTLDMSCLGVWRQTPPTVMAL